MIGLPGMDCPGISDKRKDPDRGQATGADHVEVSAPPSRHCAFAPSLRSIMREAAGNVAPREFTHVEITIGYPVREPTVHNQFGHLRT